MGSWVKTSDHQQVRSDGEKTLYIEDMGGGYWKWSVMLGGRYICDDETGEYAHDEKEAKILAELNAI